MPGAHPAAPVAAARSRRLRPALLRTALAMAALGCRGEPAMPSALPLAEFPYATARPDCAPWDGPAVSIVLTPAADTAESPAPPFVRVMAYDTAEQLVGRTVSWPGDAEVGSAAWCSAGGECAVADSGVVLLERFAGDTALAGRLRLVFPARAMLEGAFHASWHPRVPLCG